jgi:hypothetical protein
MSFFRKLFNIPEPITTFLDLTPQEKEIIKNWILEEMSDCVNGETTYSDLSFFAIKDNNLKNRIKREIDFMNNNDYIISILFGCLSELNDENKITADYNFGLEKNPKELLWRRQLIKAKYKLQQDIMRDVKLDKLLN